MAKLKPLFIIVAIAAIFILVFVPLFEINYYFSTKRVDLPDVFEAFFDHPENIKSLTIMLPMAMVLGVLILFVTAVIGKKGGFIAASLICIALFFGVLIEQYFYCEFSSVDLYWKSLKAIFAAGIYIDFGIYVLCLILGLASPVKKTTPAVNGYNPYGQYNPYAQQPYNNGYQQGYRPQTPYQQAPYGQNAQQNTYAQQQAPYGQQTPYGQPAGQQAPFGQNAQQNPYAQQQAPYGQQTPYGQSAGQQAPYGQPAQQSPYAQQQTPFGQPAGQQAPFGQNANEVPYSQPAAQAENISQSTEQLQYEAASSEAQSVPEQSDAVPASAAPADDTAASSAPSQKICPSCGNANAESASFCTGCGSPLN